MKKLHFSPSVRRVNLAQELQDDTQITKEHLQTILCQLPARKKTILLINDILHEEQLPVEDVGLALGLVATKVLIAEKTGKEVATEGKELLVEEGRLLLLEGLVPFLEDNLQHITTACVTCIGSLLGVLMAHVPLLQVLDQAWIGVIANSGTLLTSLVPLLGYALCHLGARFLKSSQAE